jgi:2',3'-cyclic-nucleotide 2'-phosphodiesterase (5'-nucleotidase family)
MRSRARRRCRDHQRRQHPRRRNTGDYVTRGDIFAELPFGNKTVKLRLTGADIRAALENGVSQVDIGAGRFPQVSGLAFTYNPGRPPGARILSVAVEGVPLDEARSYTLATNDYLAGGAAATASSRRRRSSDDRRDDDGRR